MQAYQKQKNPLIDRTLDLSLIVANKVNQYKEERNPSIINYISQISRSSCSVAANCAETQAFISDKHKQYKLNVALGECYETRLHAEMIYKLGILSDIEYRQIVSLCDEITTMVTSALYNIRNKNKK